LLVACAPDLLVCTEVCDCAEAPACADVEVCAVAIPAPIMPTIKIGRIRFTESPSYGLSRHQIPSDIGPSELQKNLLL
jgi:hypothetical protein